MTAAEADRLSSEALSTLDALGTFDRTKDVCFERYQIVVVTQGEDAARPYLEAPTDCSSAITPQTQAQG